MKKKGSEHTKVGCGHLSLFVQHSIPTPFLLPLADLSGHSKTGLPHCKLSWRKVGLLSHYGSPRGQFLPLCIPGATGARHRNTLGQLDGLIKCQRLRKVGGVCLHPVQGHLMGAIAAVLLPSWPLVFKAPLVPVYSRAWSESLLQILLNPNILPKVVFYVN